ncbi:LLM class flavin-dependent oxidoreductase [Spirillospora sp. NPDC048911]|uniref:LLM class flavin-dependent oxidoreductase n=1 Tax=Spirillospora sp. NPDC048911 TaxID=3364527 RepID=UPI003720FBDB
MMGIGLPQTRDGGATSARGLLAYLASAEQAGYDSVWVAEGPLSRPSLDPLAVLAVAATQTTRMRLGSNVLALLHYQPVPLARSIATLDRLSGGRVTLGLGLGGADLGGPRTGRAERFEQAIALLRRLWNGTAGPGDPASESFAGLQPATTPVQAPIPIWIGASAPSALRRAARIADGWIGSGRADHHRFAEGAALILDALQDHGREPGDFMIAKRSYVAIGQRPSDIEAWFRSATGGGPPPGDAVIAGDPAEIEGRLTALRAAGARALTIQPVGRDERGQMEALAEHGAVERLTLPERN